MIDTNLPAEGPVPVRSPRALMPSVLSNRPITFGRCSAYPGARILLVDGLPVDLGGRAFDLLMVLLASRGKVVAKQTIIDYVWPTTTVDESNLRFQMTVLRKALGVDRNLIKTIPGRGYIATEPASGPLCAATSAEADETPDDASGARQLCAALRLLIRAFDQHPSAIQSVEALLSGPAFAPTEQRLLKPHLEQVP